MSTRHIPDSHPDPHHATSSPSGLDRPRRVVIIGAGYAGLFAARRVRAKSEDIKVTLIDPSLAWTERTRLHQVAVGDPSVDSMLLQDLFRGTPVETVAATVVDLDPDLRQLSAVSHDGETILLEYDHLVYALGSSTDTSAVPGAAQHAHVLDSADDATEVSTTLKESPQARVTVVGAGLTGIETATEIASTHPSNPVTLITSGEIGAALSPRGRRHLNNALRRHQVTLREHTTVTGVDETGLDTATGERVSADLVVWTAGIAVPDLAARSGLAVDDRGQVLVGDTLRSVSHPDVYAAGDSAYPVRPVGAPVRASAYLATIMGAHAGTNLARSITGKPLKPLRFGYLMQSISLGRKDGLIQLTDANDQPTRLIATGRVAALIKELVERVMVVGLFKLERRLPGAFAWRPAPRTPLTDPAHPQATTERPTTEQAPPQVPEHTPRPRGRVRS